MILRCDIAFEYFVDKTNYRYYVVYLFPKSTNDKKTRENDVDSMTKFYLNNDIDAPRPTRLRTWTYTNHQRGALRTVRSEPYLPQPTLSAERHPSDLTYPNPNPSGLALALAHPPFSFSVQRAALLKVPAKNAFILDFKWLWLMRCLRG